MLSSGWSTTIQNIDEFIQYNPDNIFSILHPDVSPPRTLPQSPRAEGLGPCPCVVPTADILEGDSDSGTGTVMTLHEPVQNAGQIHPAPLTDAALIHVLAHWLGNNLPTALFSRTNSAQSRWNEKGEHVKLAPSEAGVNQRLLAIMSTESRRKEALSSFYKCFKGSQHSTYIDNPHPSSFQISRDTGSCLEALKWVCFAFPRIESEEPQYTSLAHLLFPLLNKVLGHLKGVQLSKSYHNKIAEVLLAAAKVPDIRGQVIPKIAEYLDETSPLSLRAEAVLEQSILYRLHGDYDRSESTIHDFCCHCGCQVDDCLSNFFRSRASEMQGRIRAIYGLLHRSHLENLVQREKYDLASRQIGDWPEPSSQMEWATYSSRTLTSCKIYRSQGDFEVVRQTIEMCLKTLHDYEAVYPRVICQLLDAYSDLELPDLSAQLLSSMKEKHTGTPLRRILVSSIDIDIQRGRYFEAKETIMHICGDFEAMQNLNISNELLHVRSLIAYARVSHMCSEFSEALQRWKVVLEHVKRYVSFRGEGFTYAVIHLSISLAHLQLNAPRDAASAFEQGTRVLRATKRDYWIPTLQKWHRYVLSEIYLKSGWNC